MPILGVIASSKLGKPVVTGGTLTSDATYYYRTFTSNGTLSVSVMPLTADIIVVGGGGGGSQGGSKTAGNSNSTFSTLVTGTKADNDTLYQIGGSAQTNSPSIKAGTNGITTLGFTYGGGGGAGGTAASVGSTAGGIGGTGGGGDGGSSSSTPGVNATVNTGGGGGGSGSDNIGYWGGFGGNGGQVSTATSQILNTSYVVTIGAGGVGEVNPSYSGQGAPGNGGSGIVIVRYTKAQVD